MTPKRIQAVVEKIHKCLSHMHNPNFSSFRQIEHFSLQKMKVKVRPDFEGKSRKTLAPFAKATKR